MHKLVIKVHENKDSLSKREAFVTWALKRSTDTGVELIDEGSYDNDGTVENNIFPISCRVETSDIPQKLGEILRVLEASGILQRMSEYVKVDVDATGLEDYPIVVSIKALPKFWEQDLDELKSMWELACNTVTRRLGRCFS